MFLGTKRIFMVFSCLYYTIQVQTKVARVRAWRLELFELFLPEQERTEHQQFWIINSETWKAFLTALAISNAPENDEKRR